MRPLLLLRPEPGLSRSAARAAELGLEVIACPLFRVEPVAWIAPDAGQYDGLLLTSANALHHGGPGLECLRSLPVHAVGEATADAARKAGFRVVTVGERGVDTLLEELVARRLIHLAGEDHVAPQGNMRIDRRTVYRAAPIDRPALPPLAGLIAVIHSPRAGRRLAELAQDRAGTVIAAISPAAAAACGAGWERVEAAAMPDDPTLLALAARLCQDSTRR